MNTGLLPLEKRSLYGSNRRYEQPRRHIAVRNYPLRENGIWDLRSKEGPSTPDDTAYFQSVLTTFTKSSAVWRKATIVEVVQSGKARQSTRERRYRCGRLIPFSTRSQLLSRGCNDLLDSLADHCLRRKGRGGSAHTPCLRGSRLVGRFSPLFDLVFIVARWQPDDLEPEVLERPDDIQKVIWINRLLDVGIRVQLVRFHLVFWNIRLR